MFESKDRDNSLKPVAITLRIDTHKDINEERDALDRRWASFLKACSLYPIYIPNNLEVAQLLVENIELTGVILSGGNTLSIFEEGDAPTRDEVEFFLIEWAIENNKPLLGVCRGMQCIQSFHNIPLEEIEGHVKTNHLIKGKAGERVVNSYNKYGTFSTSKDFDVLFHSSDGVVEAIAHTQKSIKGIMWHPERMTPFDSKDIDSLREISLLQKGWVYPQFLLILALKNDSSIYRPLSQAKDRF